MERLLTGRRMGLAFAVDEDAFVLGGQTNAADLPDQLRLLTPKLTHPRWDPALLARFRGAAVESFDLNFSSASARAGRELGGVIRPDDQRWRPIERAEMRGGDRRPVPRLLTRPCSPQGRSMRSSSATSSSRPAIEAMRRTVGALPRAARAPSPPRAARRGRPRPMPAPRRFTHQGDPNQAYALIGWSTLGGSEHIRERRALALAANMFETRLFDRLREEEGATYSPDAVHLAADAFPDWGVFYAAAEIRPASADTFFRIAREIVADLAARPAQPGRVRARAESGAQRHRAAARDQRLLGRARWRIGTATRVTSRMSRTYLADYRALTPEDVRRAVATYVTDARRLVDAGASR